MITKAYKFICAGLVCCGMAAVTTSCEDFFDQESDHVLYSGHDHLNNAVDTIYSVTGILNKLQALADRTILLGEVRGDLVDLTYQATSDLRDVANFNVGDDNQYNVPRDYYAVINNCNYFIANVDTALRSNRDQNIFMREYAAVKAIRAWTYLQLVLNYGSVPFVTEPILTKEEAEIDYPRADLQTVCQYFLNDLSDIPEAYNTAYPGYRIIRNQDSRFFWFPLSIVRGELNLWAGNYREAALQYYKYISQRNGMNSTYPTGPGLRMWMPGNANYTGTLSLNLNSSIFSDEGYSETSELITMIPGDSIPAEGNYSQLRNLFNSTSDNKQRFSITPSAGMEEISEAQANCCLSANGNTVTYAPLGLSNHRTGDLRLSMVWGESYSIDDITNERLETQTIYKYQTRNVHIYRRQMVYLRLAEALNQAGFPRAAFTILSHGLTNQTMQAYVMPYYSQSDSLFLAQFDFPTSRYGVVTVEDIIGMSMGSNHNTIGIHSRGSGWTPMNEYYQLPEDTLAAADELTRRQQHFVDSLLLNENALELCFEGTRFYDLMRFALRSDNPGQFMQDHIYARRGKEGRASVQADIKANLADQRNWYLRWNGKIGF